MASSFWIAGAKNRSLEPHERSLTCSHAVINGGSRQEPLRPEQSSDAARSDASERAMIQLLEVVETMRRLREAPTIALASRSRHERVHGGGPLARKDLSSTETGGRAVHVKAKVHCGPRNDFLMVGSYDAVSHRSCLRGVTCRWASIFNRRCAGAGWSTTGPPTGPPSF